MYIERCKTFKKHFKETVKVKFKKMTYGTSICNSRGNNNIINFKVDSKRRLT